MILSPADGKQIFEFTYAALCSDNLPDGINNLLQQNDLRLSLNSKEYPKEQVTKETERRFDRLFASIISKTITRCIYAAFKEQGHTLNPTEILEMSELVTYLTYDTYKMYRLQKDDKTSTINDNFDRDMLYKGVNEQEDSMDRITFDFENGEIIVNKSGQSSVLADPELAQKKSAIFAAAGLEEISGEELRNDINGLFEQLGIDAACAGPKQ